MTSVKHWDRISRITYIHIFRVDRDSTNRIIDFMVQAAVAARGRKGGEKSTDGGRKATGGGGESKRCR